MTRPTNIGGSRALIALTSIGAGGGELGGTAGDGTLPGAGTIPTATGSNSWSWGSNVALVTSNGSNALTGPYVNFASGTGITFATASNTLTISATGAAAAAASNALLRTTGGAGAVTTIAASGTHKSLMVGGANTFDITLTANCTLALTGAALSGSESSILLILRQDSTGSRTVTWPGSVTWASGSAPTLSTTASTVDFIVLETVDGGTVWFGFPVGGSSGGGTAATTVESETTFGITPAVGTDTEYARQDHTHGTPANPVTEAAVRDVGRWEPVTDGEGWVTDVEFVFEDGDIVMHWVSG